MQKIKYEFADGTTSEIEVTDEIYSVHLEIVQQERRLYWRESRRQTSLEYLTEQGAEFIDTAATPLDEYIQKENTEHTEKIIAALSERQRALLQKVFYEEKTITQVARELGLNKSSISRQLQTIYKKIKKLF